MATSASVELAAETFLIARLTKLSALASARGDLAAADRRSVRVGPAVDPASAMIADRS